ncbi:MAG TPA: hypothetical protein DCZ92_11825 [Elusimicrobia bacterium]|nr:hypothetical protein [Elusimicrobiota bacterium]
MKNNNCGRKIKGCIAAAALLLGLQPAVFAEAEAVEKVLAVGPRATYYTAQDADSGQWSPGVQARVHLSPDLGLEASIDYLRNDFGPLTTIKTFPIQGSLLAYINPGEVVKPFLLGGVGWYYTMVDGPFGYDNSTSRFGLHAGAGLDINLNKSLYLSGSYRHVWLKEVASRDASALSRTYHDSGSMITLALNFRF